MTHRLLVLASLVLAFAGADRTARAVELVFTTSDTEIFPDTDNQGWYTASGEHVAQNDNYLVGHNGADAFRNFFIFDLGDLDLGGGLFVESAVLEIQRYSAGAATEDYVFQYGLFDVTTAAATLMADHPGPFPNGEGVTIFGDLGTGASYGGIAVDPDVGASGDLLAFDLNAAAIADLTGAAGGFFGIGGAITNIEMNATIHGGSGGEVAAPPPFVRDPGIQRLVLQVVPEPATAALLAAGLIGLAARRVSAA
jgi:hypothetical protein